MEIRKFLVMAPLLLAGCSKDNDLPDPPPSCADTVGVICTWAGSTEADTKGGGFNGDGNPINQSRLNYPTDVVFDRDYKAYVIDRENQRVRLVDTNETFKTVLGTGAAGDGEANAADAVPPGVDGTLVALHAPTDMAVSQYFGYVVDWRNSKVRKIDLASTRTHVWGGGGADFGDGGEVANAKFSFPSKMIFLADPGEFFIIDQTQQCIRKILQDGSKITTIAGTIGAAGYDEGGRNQVPLLSKFHFDNGNGNPKVIQPSGGLALDRQGNLYIADSLNHVIRMVTFDRSSGESLPSKITTVAGIPGQTGLVNGPAEAAKFSNPTDLAIDADGVLYIADTGNNAVRKYDPVTKQVFTVAGTGEAGFSGDGADPAAAKLNRPLGVGFDQNQVHLYIADTVNHRVRRIRLH